MSTPVDVAATMWETGRLWQNGLAAVPVALMVAAICRWAPCRPATRHLLWLVVLVVLLAPMMGVGDLAHNAVSRASVWAKGRLAAASAPPRQAGARRSVERGDVVPLTAPRNFATTPPVRTLLMAPGMPMEYWIIEEPIAVDRWRGSARRDRQPARADRARTLTDGPAARSDAGAPRPVRDELAGVASTGAPPPVRETGSRQGRDADAPFAFAPEEIAPTAGVAAATPGQEPVVLPRSGGASAAGLWGTRMLAVRDAIVARPPFPSAIWAGGMGALVVGAFIRTWSQRRMLRRAAPAPEDVRRMVAATAAMLGLARPPETWMVPDRISPMVWCGLKRRLLLPTELWAELDEVGRGAVVIHELAHLRRKDHWTCWAELAACAVYWWHPVAWWVRRRLRDEADLCCDAWVTALFPMDRRVYAQALLDTRKYISRTRWSEPAVGLSATAGGAKRFARRLTMVMTHRNRPGGSWTGVALAAVLTGAGLASGPLWACPPEEGKEALGKARTVAVSAQPAMAAMPAAPAAPPMPAMALMPTMAPMPAMAPMPGAFAVVAPAPAAQPDSTFERHMAGRGHGDPVSRDLESLLELAGDRLDVLDERLDALRGLLEVTHGADAEDSKDGEDACGDDCEQECVCEPCDDACGDVCEDVCEEEAHAAGDRAAEGGRALVLIVGGDGQVQVYRLDEDRTGDLVAMLEEADGPVVVQHHGRVAVDGADVNDLVAATMQERAARALAAEQEVRAAQQHRTATTLDVYRQHAEAYQRAAEQTRQRSEEMLRRAEELERKTEEMNGEAGSRPRSQRRRMEADAERLSRQTEELREAAEAMSEQADELIEKAAELGAGAEEAAEEASAEMEMLEADFAERALDADVAPAAWAEEEAKP